MNPLLQISNTSNLGFSLISIIVSLILCLGIFLILRAFMLWYWKVNKIVQNQQIQIEQQRELLHKLDQLVEINLKKDNNPNITYKSNP